MSRTFTAQIRRHELGGWQWRVVDENGDVWDGGDTLTRRGARREARWSAKSKTARREAELNPRWENVQ